MIKLLRIIDWYRQIMVQWTNNTDLFFLANNINNEKEQIAMLGSLLRLYTFFFFPSKLFSKLRWMVCFVVKCDWSTAVGMKETFELKIFGYKFIRIVQNGDKNSFFFYLLRHKCLASAFPGLNKSKPIIWFKTVFCFKIIWIWA